MKHEWIIHHILDEPLSYHTHGLDKFGSLEIELLLPVSPFVAANYLNAIGEAIKDGLKIEDGLYVEGVFNIPVFFFKVKSVHSEDYVYRVIIPDSKGFYPWTQEGHLRCDEPYKSQITFDKTKVFMCKVADKARVEETKGVEYSIFSGFELRGDEYVRPMQYYVPDSGKGDSLVGIGPYCADSHGFTRFLNHLRGLFEVEYKVVCVDLDETDSIHKPFLDWF